MTEIKKQGQLFSIDMMLAIVVVVIIIGSSAYFFTNTEEDFMNNIQMVKTGGDIVAILEAEGALHSLSSATIKSEINSILPVNYEMRLKINTTLYPYPIIIETDTQIKDNAFVVNGKRFFVFEQDNVLHTGTVQYEVWPR